MPLDSGFVNFAHAVNAVNAGIIRIVRFPYNNIAILGGCYRIFSGWKENTSLEVTGVGTDI